MRLSTIDLVLISGYIAATLVIGFYIAKRASRSIRNYFLGGNEIPWYALGVSNASGMFDISGTMWLVYLLFVYVWIGIIAMQAVTPEMLDAVVPDGWRSPFFGWDLGLDWTGLMDAANARIAEDGWSLFSVFFMMMLFKGVLQSGAGPAPNYDMQRILSARTPEKRPR